MCLGPRSQTHIKFGVLASKKSHLGHDPPPGVLAPISLLNPGKSPSVARVGVPKVPMMRGRLGPK